MRRVPDIIIAVGVVVGALALGTGFRVVGVVSFLVALIIGWRRNWCIGTFEELLQSCEHSASHTDPVDTTPDTSHDDGADTH